MKKFNLLTLIALLLIIFVSSCNNNQNETTQKQRPLTEAELKQQLADKECLNPSEYLSGNMEITPILKNVFSSKVKGMTVNFEINSKATLAVYKDIQISIKLLSKTKTVIAKYKFTVYDFIYPGKRMSFNREFKISNQKWKDFSTFKWEILGAKCKK